ncbi:MAG: hypothetical protein GOVbin1096_62 [Prokaryotic dsDNA virus sp.]|jgi:hypothetical protein|nr:MAG: hypothetical protein GOVbin1096_62 [Prokaryotic dsDNA virus sp.]|tara:strand:- start:82709 stop:83575 length:867 start_codon:yes stop_codon:yes gene_type:complete
MKQFDRQYRLVIGDAESGDGLAIQDLQIQFRVRKSVDNKKKIDRCSISVYNLSDESLAYLETDYPVAVFSCGYQNQLVRLFYGEVLDVETKKQGTDRVTKIDITPSFSEMTHQLMSELVPENGTVEDVINVIRKAIGVAKGVYKGAALKQKIVYGYPLSGTPKEMIDKVCRVYNLQWKIEGESLYINDVDSVESEIRELAPVISPSTGLIDRPYFFSDTQNKSSKNKEKKSGVRFTALLNPNVLPGALVRVDYGEQSDYYRVEEVEFKGDFRGNSWYMDCICSKRPEA